MENYMYTVFNDNSYSYLELNHIEILDVIGRLPVER